VINEPQAPGQLHLAGSPHTRISVEGISGFNRRVSAWVNAGRPGYSSHQTRKGIEEGKTMKALLHLSALIDGISEVLGKFAGYLVLICCLVSAGNAIVRYVFNYSSNGWLEIQWYMFAFIVLIGASYTLRMNEHVRVDIIYGAISPRARLWVDIIGLVFFLLPACAYLAWLSWPEFALSFAQNETSSNAGGLIRWPVKFIIFAGFALLVLQGISELVKRIGALGGLYQLDTKYEKPLQ
jgi:TRAP-type mannitol/chloroaromatic compound transport system permease small subunit